MTVWIAGHGQVYLATTTILALENHPSTGDSPHARLSISQITHHPLAAVLLLQVPPSRYHRRQYLLSPRSLCSHQPIKSRCCSLHRNNLPFTRLYTIDVRVIASTSGSPIPRENIASPPLMPSRACNSFPCITTFLEEIARSETERNEKRREGNEEEMKIPFSTSPRSLGSTHPCRCAGVTILSITLAVTPIHDPTPFLPPPITFLSCTDRYTFVLVMQRVFAFALIYLGIIISSLSYL